MTDTPAIEIDRELLIGFTEEALESLAEIDSLLVQLESAPADQDIINAIFRPMHSIKGNAPFFGLTSMRNLAHALEDLLALVRDGELAVSGELTEILLEGADEVTAMLKRIENEEAEVADTAHYEQLLARIVAFKDGGSANEQWNKLFQQAEQFTSSLTGDTQQQFDQLWKVLKSLSPLDSIEACKTDEGQQEVAPEISEHMAQPATEKSVPSKVDAPKTMRVSEEHIDTFLGFVGELLILGEMLSYLERRVSLLSGAAELSNEFKRINESYSTVSENLQKSLMAVRKVTVKSALQKVPRLVRDIAQVGNKEIQVELSGEEVEVDKSLIELIDAPLTHMVRNAADHGIETPEIREQHGKPTKGVIEVSVSETDSHIVLEVKDDGAGLNYDRIQAKAEELGIVKPGVQLTEEQVVDFLFCAGVSTAEQVTDVSGRGVGMDVVKRSIESAGGSIEVTSRAGQGSIFCIRLIKSVTTTIIEGLVFRVGRQHFVVPCDRVNEIFFAEDAQVFNAAADDNYIVRQERVMPLVPSHTILDVQNESEPAVEPEIVISLTANKKEVGLQVHSVLAVQQVVVKDIKHLTVKGDVYAGGALIGEGQIALILDVDRFCSGYDMPNLAERSFVTHQNGDAAEARREDIDWSIDATQVTDTFLLAQIGAQRQAAIPLSSVSRLEKVQLEQIEKARGSQVVQYRGALLPLFDLASHFRSDLNRSSEVDLVVWSEGKDQVGLIVDSILDIVDDTLSIQEIANVQGVSGTAIIKDRITDILQVSALLQSAAPELLDFA